mgnify:CR=1 FL=1|jgi:hypothetical protein
MVAQHPPFLITKKKDMIDFRGLKIKLGDKLKVIICEDVERSGTVVFEDAAYCLEYYDCGTDRTTPLTNYAPSCKFEKIEI